MVVVATYSHCNMKALDLGFGKAWGQMTVVFQENLGVNWSVEHKEVAGVAVAFSVAVFAPLTL